MKMIYWTSTWLVALMLVISALSYFFHKGTIDGVRELGFPDYFRVQLAIMKVLGAVVIVVPQIPVQVKEWGYAGIGLFFVTAIIAHTVHKDPIGVSLISVAFLILLAVSNVYLHKLAGA